MILLLFLPVVLGQFIPIEKDSTTIAPPVAHGNRAILRENVYPPQRQQIQRQFQPQPQQFVQSQPQQFVQVQPQQAFLVPVNQVQQVMPQQGRRTPHRKNKMSRQEAAYLRQLEDWDDQREKYKEAAQAQRDEYYRQYFDRMRVYAIQTHIRRYNQMIAMQAQERERFQKTMGEFGVREEDIIRQIGPDATAVAGNTETASKPPSPFGNAKTSNEIRGSRAQAVPSLIQPQRPSVNEPRPENREVHRKAAALEALCARFLPTVRKHCFAENKTEEQFKRRCAAYFHDCQTFIPQPDPLYSIANAFSSNVGIGVGVGVKGIPYYPINEEGAVEVGRQINVPFGSWGGGYSDHFGVRDYWSQYQEAGANWYEGKYGYKSGWSVPLVQSLGIEGDTHAVASVPIKPGELGKPIGVDVGGGVGPYYQQNQHVGVDYLNGQVGTNFGVGVPMAGVGVNTGVSVGFPSVNDIIGK